MGHASGVGAADDVETQLPDVADASLAELSSLREKIAATALKRVLDQLLSSAGAEGAAVSPFTSYIP